MARARTPVARAAITGAAAKNPQRHKGRKVPANQRPLGKPSRWLTGWGQKAFEAFKAELPWLKESHRMLVELAADLRGHLSDPERGNLSLQARQELRRCLAQLGATPADESKVNFADGDEEDPLAGLFTPPANTR